MSDLATIECVSFPCDFSAARDATRRLRRFLTTQGLTEPELFACELALTEACNNAVQHVGVSGRNRSVLAEAICAPRQVEFRVTDHTDGFDWPAAPLRPPPPDAEHGRGLFLICSVMDGATYARGDDANVLTMWKSRQRG